jgi:hypothetical protein
MSLSAAQRRKLRKRLEYSSNKCADCGTGVRYWYIVKDIPTCPTCAGTRPLGGTIERQHT